MEIILYPAYLIEKINEEGLDESDFEALKSELKDVSNDVKLREVNLGGGADWMVILAVVNSIVNVFLVGDKILKGIDGWIALSKKIKALVDKKTVKFLDKDGCTLLAIEILSRKYNINSLEKLFENELLLGNLAGLLPDRKSDDFIAKPKGYHVFGFLVNNERTVVIGVDSIGTAEILRDIEIPSMYP